MTKKTCGNCKHYISGKGILGNLFRGGSVCQSTNLEASRTLREQKDLPLNDACWTSNRTQENRLLWEDD